MTIQDLCDYLNSSLTIIQIAKLLKDYGREEAFQQICQTCEIIPEYEFDACYSALESFCDHVDHSYDEDTEEEIFYFSDSSMMEYYRLCEEYARLKQIPFEDTPYVLKAEDHAHEWLYVSGCYYCDYTLQTDTQKEWGCRICFSYSSCDFWEYVPLLQRMLEVLEFYKRELPKLRTEVDTLKRSYALAVVPQPTKKENTL